MICLPHSAFIARAFFCVKTVLVTNLYTDISHQNGRSAQNTDNIHSTTYWTQRGTILCIKLDCFFFVINLYEFVEYNIQYLVCIYVLCNVMIFLNVCPTNFIVLKINVRFLNTDFLISKYYSIDRSHIKSVSIDICM